MDAIAACASPPSGRGLRPAARLVAPLVSLSLAAACLLDAGSAQACSCSCARRDFTPENGATVPANVPSVLWSGLLSENVVTLAALVGQTEVPIDVTLTPVQPTGWLVTPSAPLELGTTYRARGANFFCSSDPSDTVVDFGVVAAAPLPAAADLGILQVSPP